MIAFPDDTRLEKRRAYKERNSLQDQTGWRMLSSSVPFERRFDPAGPYAEAFEAGGPQSYFDKILEEKKKQKQDAMFQGAVRRDVFNQLPRWSDWLKKSGFGTMSMTARPTGDY